MKNQSLLKFWTKKVNPKPEASQKENTPVVSTNTDTKDINEVQIKDCANIEKQPEINNETESTPNKSRGVKNSEDQREMPLLLSAETYNQTPSDKKNTPSKSSSSCNIDLLEENKSEDKMARPQKQLKRKRKSSKKQREAKESEEVEAAQKIKKRESKRKQKTKLDANLSLSNTIKEVGGSKSQFKLGSSGKLKYDFCWKELAQMSSSTHELDVEDKNLKSILLNVLCLEVEGSTLPLSNLVNQCESKLSSIEGVTSQLLTSLNLEQFIKSIAERKAFGLIKEDDDPLESIAPEALYCWELADINAVEVVTSQEISLMRTSRLNVVNQINGIQSLISAQLNDQLKDLQKLQNKQKKKQQKEEEKEEARKRKEEQRLQKQKEKEQKEAEKLEKKRQAELEAELKRKQKEEEKEKKRQEAEQLRLKKEEEKRLKQEELQRKKEEAALKKEEAALKKKQEEEKKKEEMLKAEREKENQQKKLLSFFKKDSPKKDVEMEKEPEVKKKTKDLLNTIERAQKEVPDKVEDIVINLRDYCQSLRAAYLKELGEEAKAYKNKPKRKDIYIEGSHRKLTCIWQKVSSVIRGRNPFARDEAIIDYDMDSEEEFEEENGEDIVSEKDDEEDEYADEDEKEGFIVPDGYLSQSEKDDDEADNWSENGYGKNRVGYTEIKKERQINTIITPSVTIARESTIASLEQFKIFTAKSYIEFPLNNLIKDLDENSDAEDKKERMDPNAINNKIKEFILMIHGSYEPKNKIIEMFAEQHSEWSKASIERKIREIASKEKEESQGKFRYLVQDKYIQELPEAKAEIEEVWISRYNAVQEEVDRIEKEKQIEKDKEKEEKERLKRIEREKKEELKRIEKEKKDAEKLKAKQEKERIKQLEKDEKKRLKEENKILKQKVKEAGLSPSKLNISSKEQSNIIKEKVAMTDKSGVVKRGRGRPKGSRNKKDSSNAPISLKSNCSSKEEYQQQKKETMLKKDPESKSILKFFGKT